MATSKAKFGPALITLGYAAICWIHRTGFCMKAIGLINTPGRPVPSG